MTAIIVCFVVAYTAIALEHPLKVNKAATALIACGLMWTLYAFAAEAGGVSTAPHGIASVIEQLGEALGETAAVVFFLIGAMTIVEVTDSHGGFAIITNRIRATTLASLLWVIGVIAFFLSSVLDNMTTTIVMVTLMKRLLKDVAHRHTFAGIIVIAANAGGAWTPIGDVTTTMLWIGGQITTGEIMKGLFIPSLLCLLAPLTVATLGLEGRVVAPEAPTADSGSETTESEKMLMFCMGLGSLLFVPVFKAVTHLPPYLGILFALGILWLVSEVVHRGKTQEQKEHLTMIKALKRIDMSSVVFFVGILLAVAVMSANGQLAALALWLGEKVPDQSLIVLLIGLASAVVDNIPLVAATMGMYPLAQYPTDSFIWEFLAYCAGTGGSILVIGSAAGVAAMGIEDIHFGWYAKKIAPLAAIGYFAGAGAYLLEHALWT